MTKSIFMNPFELKKYTFVYPQDRLYLARQESGVRDAERARHRDRLPDPVRADEDGQDEGDLPHRGTAFEAGVKRPEPLLIRRDRVGRGPREAPSRGLPSRRRQVPRSAAPGSQSYPHVRHHQHQPLPGLLSRRGASDTGPVFASSFQRSRRIGTSMNI